MLTLSLFINFLFQSSSPLLYPFSLMLLSFSTNASDKRVPKRTYCETSLERLTPNLFYSQLHGAPKPYSVLFTWLRNLDCAMSITEHVYVLLLFVSILYLAIGRTLVVSSISETLTSCTFHFHRWFDVKTSVWWRSIAGNCRYHVWNY